MSTICSAESAEKAGIPRSGRPMRIIGPSVSPLLSCRTSGDRTRSGPLLPWASLPSHRSGSIRPTITAFSSRAGNARTASASGLAGPQRVWLAVYDKEDERKLRLRLGLFEEATVHTGHRWLAIDLPHRIERMTGAPTHHVVATPPRPAVHSTPAPAHERTSPLLAPLRALGWGRRRRAPAHPPAHAGAADSEAPAPGPPPPDGA